MNRTHTAIGRAATIASLALALALASTSAPAQPSTSPSARFRTSADLTAKKKAAKGTIKVVVTGSGTYSITGKGFGKAATRSKKFKVKPGKYTISAPDGTAKPGKVTVRKGKTTTVRVTFPPDAQNPPITPAPTTPPPSPTPTPTPTEPGGDAIGAVERISVDAVGSEANSGSQDSDWSADGTLVALESYASNLVPGDTNGTTDVFVKTLSNGAIQRVSTAADGTEGNDSSFDPQISPDGTRIAFQSGATNLVPGDTNNSTDVFVKTLSNGAIQRVSTAADGTQANRDSFNAPVWSPDGTRIAFSTNATNLTGGDPQSGLFVKTLASGAIEKVQGGSAQDPAWSPDGAQLAYASYQTNVVPGDTNNTGDLFVKHLGTGTVELVSTDSNGQQSNGFSTGADWSPDGKRILFTSEATNLVPGDTNDQFDVFVKTLDTGAIELLSKSSTDQQGNAGSSGAQWSPDGTRIVYSSLSSNLVPRDTNGLDDVFITSVATGSVWRVSTNANGEQATDANVNDYVASWNGDWSPDGASVIVHSNAAGLVPNDTNQATDIFIKTLP